MAVNVSSTSRYPVPNADICNPYCVQTFVRKSRFLAQVCRCASRAAGREFVERVRYLNPDATHNCWAFAAGAPGESALVGSSDDGEPRGTAGRPMLNVLLHCGIGQICVVVSRWFGGIKLGTGGLARAYQNAVAENLKSLPLVSAIPRSCWLLDAEYAWLPEIRHILPHYEGEIEKEEYGSNARLLLSAPLDQGEALRSAIAGLSGGKARLVEKACDPD